VPGLVRLQLPRLQFCSNISLAMPAKPRKRANRSRGASEVRCTITKVTGVDPQGRPAFGASYEELCSILKLPGDNADISAKIGSSPDYPKAPLLREDAVLLLRITTKADVDDVIEVVGMRLKAVAIAPSYDGVGKLANHVVRAVTCD